jgi:hypothetical protein
MTLESALVEAETRDPAIVTSRVLAQRHRRRDGAATFQRERLTESKDLAERDAERARGDATAERGVTAALQAELTRTRAEASRVERERLAMEEDHRAASARATRTRVRDGVLVLHVVLMVVGVFTWLPLLVGTGIAAVLFWERSRAWVRGADSGASALVAAGVGVSPDLLALVAWLWPHLR